MVSIRISEKILAAIRENVGEDKILGKFLEEVIYDEAEHSKGKWWSTRAYRDKIESYAEKWQGDHED